MAHNEYDILNKLLLLLDDERNDIFIHYDKKCKLPSPIELKYSNIHVFKKVDVGWGEDSQIECEMFLFNEAYKKGPFDYYHLLSGVDLPLKSNDYIHDFFDQNKGKEFVGIMDEQSCFICYKRVCYYYFFVRYERRKWGRFIVWLNKISVKFQKMVGINRNKDVIFKKGANWVSVTQSFVEYILSNREIIKQMFCYTYCADEMFIQTLLYNSGFKDCLYIPKEAGEHNMCVREIDWDRGNPYIWDNGDFEYLKKSNNIFARKFNSGKSEIVDKIYDYIKESNNRRK